MLVLIIPLHKVELVTTHRDRVLDAVGLQHPAKAELGVSVGIISGIIQQNRTWVHLVMWTISPVADIEIAPTNQRYCQNIPLPALNMQP